MGRVDSEYCRPKEGLRIKQTTRHRNINTQTNHRHRVIENKQNNKGQEYC